MKKALKRYFGLPVFIILSVIQSPFFFTGTARGQDTLPVKATEEDTSVMEFQPWQGPAGFHYKPQRPGIPIMPLGYIQDAVNSLDLAGTSCQNSDFSLGNFSNWSGCYGKWCADTLPASTRCTGSYTPFNPACSNSNMPWYNTPTGGHFNIQNPGQDNCINALSKVFPGDAHSALIGNRVCSNSNAGGYVDELTYQITYDPNHSFFIYRCAVVLANIQDPTHNTANRRPRFTFAIKDHNTGVLIDPTCGFYDLWPGDGVTTWNQTGAPLNFYWKDWSTIGVDLSVLSGITTGQVLDVVFTIHGCGFQAHTGYAYVSAFCGAMTITLNGCEGSGSVTLEGPPGFTQYSWQGPFCPSCTMPPPIYPGNPVTITTAQGAVTGNIFYLTVTALNGCTVSNVAQVIAFTNVSAAFTHGNACVNQGMQFNDQSTCSQNSITNWDWDFGDASPIVHIQNPVHPYSIANTYTVRLIAYTSDGCSDTITSQIIVDPLPNPTFTTGPISACLNLPGQVYTTEAGKLNYIWTIPPQATVTAGGQSTDNSVTLTWNTTGSYSIGVNYSEPNSLCTASQPTILNITVHSLPVPPVFGSNVACVNTPGSVFSTLPGMTNYQWSVTGGSITGGGGTADNTATVMWSTTGLQSISVNYNDANGCTAVAPTVFPVTVNPLPTATIAGIDTVCQNAASPLITFTGASSSAPYTFTYNINGGANQIVTTIAGNSVTVAAPTNVVGSYTYNLVSVQDGSVTSCSQAQTGTAVVTVNPLPTATIAGNDTVCQNSGSPLVTFTGGSSTTPYTFTYNINGGANQFVTTVAGNSVSVAAPTNIPGTFTYNLVSVLDGSTTTCSQAQAGSAVVIVNPLPTASISIPGPAAVCQFSASPLITFTGAAATAPYTFTYNINGGPNQFVTTTVGNSVTVPAPTNILGTFTYNLISVQESSSKSCSQAQPGSVVVIVSALPSPTITGLDPVCTLVPTTYNTQPLMSNYIWLVSAGGTIAGGGSTTDSTITINWTTPGPHTVSVNYIQGIGCTALAPYVFNVNVKPRPAVTNAANSTICSGTLTNIPLQASLLFTTFTWTATGSSGNISGFSASGGPVISQVLVNTGFNVENVDYAVTPSLNGCDGTTVHFIVSVNPVADVYFNPNGQILCSGTNTGISLLSHVAGAIFSYTASGSSGNVNGFTPGIVSPIVQTLTNSGTGPETVTYNVSPSFNTCPGSPNQVVVTVNPLPLVSYPNCNDAITTTAAQPFKLKGGLPPGGTYTGAGVNTEIFYPSIAGLGNHTITYSYLNTWGCTANAQQVITVINPPFFLCDNPMTDIRDNKQYPTVKLGTQCWMAINLNYGTLIASAQMQRDNCVPEKYCFGDNPVNCTNFGGLYQWDEMMQYDNAAAEQGFCPPGWHIPSEPEWGTLFSFYISNGFAGSPLKYTGFSGFNALLSGARFNNVNWDFGTFAVMLWSSTLHGFDKAWAHGMNTYNPSVSYYPSARSHAFNLRCIKD